MERRTAANYAYWSHGERPTFPGGKGNDMGKIERLSECARK